MYLMEENAQKFLYAQYAFFYVKHFCFYFKYLPQQHRLSALYRPPRLQEVSVIQFLLFIR